MLAILVWECELASKEMGITAIPGVELTHVPAHLIAEAALKAKGLGAQIVIVHGETITEPVEPGTNMAALKSPHVDVLAHPGMLSEVEARLARARGICLELTSRRGHSLTNGHVARVALAAGAPLIVNSDAHAPEELLTAAVANHVALRAGLTTEEATATLQTNPQVLLKKLGRPPVVH